eukprot:TRINITY_DN5004_c0_g1_i1.p1 TRINITY_DN5004_c0_g1~~TRINITY_DN5004_c0_g1_i1.p1  ORF type:complete len:504 (+),score=156.69 TRINITY_DN5004_c0_g1_i1:76-1587(+)
MGRKNKSGSNKQKLKTDLSDLMSDLFSPMPANKREELNALVEKLLEKCFNFASEPLTPSRLMEEHKAIRALVEKVMVLEATNMNRRLIGPRAKHMPHLLEWLESHGGLIQGVEPKELNTKECGLFVSKEEGLNEGDLVIRIPRKCIMSSETARGSSIGSLVDKDPMLKTMPHVALALHLLIEKNSPASFWEPYINALPTSYPELVLYYSIADLELLKGSPSLVDALKQYKFVARQYAYFYRKFQNMMLRDYFTYEEYRWAVSTVTTRQNKVPTTKPDAHGLSLVSTALIPLWDLANHASEPPVLSTDFDLDSDSLLCLSNSSFKHGQEFNIFYGSRGNMDFLIHNGFVPEGNAGNFYSLKIAFGRNDPLFELKNELLEKVTGSVSLGSYSLRKDPPLIEDSLLAFIRVNAMSEEELKDTLTKDEEIASLKGEEKVSVDPKAYGFLKTRCELLLKSYPQSLEEDKKILKEKGLPLHHRYCVSLRSLEKEILSNVINACSERISA